MFKRLFVALAAFFACSVFAADVNTASQADLEAVKGIGPGIATRIIDARRNGDFKDWNDFVARVHGIGATSAGKLSAQGLAVNGMTYAGTPAAVADTAAPIAAKKAAPPVTSAAASVAGTPAAASTAALAASTSKAAAPASAVARAGRMSTKERQPASAASAAASK